MNVLILQASPRAKGNTAWMAEEYKNAAEAAGHNVTARERGAQTYRRLSGVRVLPRKRQRRVHPER